MQHLDVVVVVDALLNLLRRRKRDVAFALPGLALVVSILNPKSSIPMPEPLAPYPQPSAPSPQP